MSGTGDEAVIEVASELVSSVYMSSYNMDLYIYTYILAEGLNSIGFSEFTSTVKTVDQSMEHTHVSTYFIAPRKILAFYISVVNSSGLNVLKER